MTPTTYAAALLALSLVADGDDTAVEGSRIETTESEIRWVHNTGTGAWAKGQGWTLVEGLRLGSVEGDPSQQFGRLWALTPIRESVAVLDGQAQDIRIVGPTRRHLRTFGHQGEGPGEFRRAEGLATDGEGGIWVLDGLGGRIHHFTSGGDFVRSLPHIPAEFPAIDHIRSDRAGHLLVFPHLDGVEQDRVVDVFDEQTGMYLGRVDLPVPFRRSALAALAVAGALYVQDLGPFDVDQIVRLDVVR